MTPHQNRRRYVTLSFITLFLSACTPIIHTQGLDPEVIKTDQIKIGIHTKDQIIELLGTPTSKSAFDENTWYYISKQKAQEAFFRPEIIQQKALVISFNNQGIVNAVDYHDTIPEKELIPSQNKTLTAGHETTLTREIFSNLGRMNTKKPTGPRIPD